MRLVCSVSLALSISHLVTARPSAMRRPAVPPPVKEMASTPSWRTRAGPTSVPGTTLMASSGRPASSMTSASWNAESGAYDDGLTITAVHILTDQRRARL